MFTGIIEEVGTFESLNNGVVTINCHKILESVVIGDSIAVCGVCLTVISFGNNFFKANISPETLRITKFNEIKKGDSVNLERAMLATSRFNGHIVTGHVDAVAKILEIKKMNECYELKIQIPSHKQSAYLVNKGSVSIDGISLTVCDVKDSYFTLSIIPHTFDNTNLKGIKGNDTVNIEFDILAKYIEKNIYMKDNSTNITEDFLKNNGFM